jgi:hypothetical protein
LRDVLDALQASSKGHCKLMGAIIWAISMASASSRERMAAFLPASRLSPASRVSNAGSDDPILIVWMRIGLEAR